MDLSPLDLLASGVLLLDGRGTIRHANAAVEDLFGTSRKQLLGRSVYRLFDDAEDLRRALDEAAAEQFADKRLPLTIDRPGYPAVPVSATVVVLYGQAWPVLLELSEIEKLVKVERETGWQEQAEANRELLRNLAHEVKNPLGGLRGAAQLLAAELPDPRLTEYTNVIIAEADRLQNLVDRLLAPHRVPRVLEDLNIHEVCERVVVLLGAEYPRGLNIVRDYDASVPDLCGDRAQLIQAVLNIARNAAQALATRREANDAQIILRTRIARQVTVARRRHRLAISLQVIDNGPGIDPALKERIFHPLVSGAEGGTGLGLTLAQTLVQRHGGTIDCDSRPGYTAFRLLLPLTEPQ